MWRLLHLRVPANLRTDRDQAVGRHDEVAMARRTDERVGWISETGTANASTAIKALTTRNGNVERAFMTLLLEKTSVFSRSESS